MDGRKFGLSWKQTRGRRVREPDNYNLGIEGNSIVAALHTCGRRDFSRLEGLSVKLIFNKNCICNEQIKFSASDLAPLLCLEPMAAKAVT